MVKRQKEKQYESAREHRVNAKLRAGGAGGDYAHNLGSVQRRLPFHCCALTLVPFVDPVCSSSSSKGNHGVMFDNTALMDFVMQYKKDPITGNPITINDVVTLHMDKDEEGRWQCPILTKPFNDNSKIVAVRDRETKSAYVYSYEAYHELNVKTKNWLDLTTNKKFSPKKDVWILNDPQDDDLQKARDISSFWHIRNARSIEKSAAAEGSQNVNLTVTASRVMDQYNKEKKEQAKRSASNTDAQQSKKKPKIYADEVTGVQYTAGKAASSFTSTAMTITDRNETREATQEEILVSLFAVLKAMKKKGYVRLHTNLGDILLELHCDIAPRTCFNFLGLCEKSAYDGTKFHRLIPNFMIQGGKHKDVGSDQSIWGNPFADEFDDRLKHEGAGVLSMANAGPNTNKQQFFITFKSCPHLNRKHSIFGSVVDGMDILKKMEKLATDKKDRPLEPIVLQGTEVLVNPIKEGEEKERVRIEKLRQKHTGSARPKSLGSSAQSKPSSDVAIVGKYLPKSTMHDTALTSDQPDIPSIFAPAPNKAAKKAIPVKTQFGDFSGW